MPGPPDPAAPGLPLTVEAKLRAAFDLSPTVLTITADGRFVDVNDAFLRLHSYARAGVGRGTTFTMRLKPAARAAERTETAARAPCRRGVC